MNAFAGRVSPVSETDLPCLLVVTPEESVASLTIGNRPTQERRTTMHVVACVQADDDAYDALDALALRIEAAMLEPKALSPHAKSIVLVSSSCAAEAMPDGVAATATADLVFECIAFTQAGQPASTR